MDLEKIDVDKLKDARPAGFFHGEIWMKCPYCGKDIEMMGFNPGLTRIKDGYNIIRCMRCKKYYRDRR